LSTISFVFLYIPARTKERTLPALVGLMSFDEVLPAGNAFDAVSFHGIYARWRLRFAAVPVVAVYAISCSWLDDLTSIQACSRGEAAIGLCPALRSLPFNLASLVCRRLASAPLRAKLATLACRFPRRREPGRGARCVSPWESAVCKSGRSGRPAPHGRVALN
jgi:hypothetical protein